MFVIQLGTLKQILQKSTSNISEEQLQKLHLKFRKQFSRQIVLTVIKKDHFQILKKKSWLRSAGWFDWTIWKPVFNILDQVPAERIYFTNFRVTDILFDVVHIDFPNLRQMHLDDNMIINIEALAAFYTPKLRKLDMRRNLVMDISCLRRCQFPMLQQLNLSDNTIQTCTPIAECYFPDLKKVIIQEKTYLNIYIIYQQGRGQRQLKSTARVNGYDMRWIIKLESPCLQVIKYAADARVIRSQLQRQIGHKYYKIRVQKKGMEVGSLLPLLSF